MKRREFITLLGGALTSRPILANAQPAVRMRTVGVLIGLGDDAEARSRLMAFEQGLKTEGWSVGQNLRIEYRYAEGDSGRMQAFAKELVELKPEPEDLVKIEAKLKSGLPDDTASAAAPAEHTLQHRDQLERLRD